MQSFSRFCYQFSLKVESKYKNKKSVTLNEKIITTPLNFLLFTDFKEAQHPWWEFEYALHLREERGELFANFIQGETKRLIIVIVLVILYCFETT